jgi:hypothetical protein
VYEKSFIDKPPGCQLCVWDGKFMSFTELHQYDPESDNSRRDAGSWVFFSYEYKG